MFQNKILKSLNLLLVVLILNSCSVNNSIVYENEIIDYTGINLADKRIEDEKETKFKQFSAKILLGDKASSPTLLTPLKNSLHRHNIHKSTINIEIEHYKIIIDYGDSLEQILNPNRYDVRAGILDKYIYQVFTEKFKDAYSIAKDTDLVVVFVSGKYEGKRFFEMGFEPYKYSKVVGPIWNDPSVIAAIRKNIDTVAKNIINNKKESSFSAEEVDKFYSAFTE
jgi:hypothetical protein